MKKLILIPLLAFAAYAAEPFQPRPLLIDPTNATPISPAGFFASNSAAINAVVTPQSYAFNTNQFSVSSVTNVNLKDGIKVTNMTANGFALIASGTPSSDDVLSFATDGAGGWHYDSNVKYSDLVLRTAANSMTATNQMPELQVNTLQLTNNVTYIENLLGPASSDGGTNFCWLDAAYAANTMNVTSHITFTLVTNAPATNLVRYSEVTLYNTNSATTYSLAFPATTAGWYPIGVVATNVVATTNMVLWFKTRYTNVYYGTSR